jgi:hypothetical protein
MSTDVPTPTVYVCHGDERARGCTHAGHTRGAGWIASRTADTASAAPSGRSARVHAVAFLHAGVCLPVPLAPTSSYPSSTRKFFV